MTHPVLAQAARMGRSGDVILAHVTPGDVVFPVERLDARSKKLLKELFRGANLRPQRFTVGNRYNKKNPTTGLPEFFDADGGGMYGSEGVYGAADAFGDAGGPTVESVSTDNASDMPADNGESDARADNGESQSDASAAFGDPGGSTAESNRGMIEGGMGRIDQTSSTDGYSGWSNTGIGFLDREIDDITHNPGRRFAELAGSALGRALSYAVPPFGVYSAIADISNLFPGTGLPSLPTIGGLASAGYTAIRDNEGDAPAMAPAGGEAGGDGVFGGDAIDLAGIPNSPLATRQQRVAQPVGSSLVAGATPASAPDSNFGTGIDDIVRRAGLA